MADAAERALIAYFDGAAQAEQAAQDLRTWDKANEEIKLGALGVLTKNAEGKLETKNLSARNTGKGAKIGLGLGALAAVFSGGLTLLPTALGGAVGGGLVGSLSKKGLGLSDDDLQQLSAELEGGRAALLVVCDDPEVEATTAQLAASGGTVRRPADAVSAEALQEAAQAAGRGRGRPDESRRPGRPRRPGGAGIEQLTPAPGGRRGEAVPPRRGRPRPAPAPPHRTPPGPRASVAAALPFETRRPRPAGARRRAPAAARARAKWVRGVTA